MKIALTGASGFIATALIPHLQNAGHTLLLVGRNPTALQTKYPQFSACDYADLSTYAHGYDVLIHTAVLNNNAPAPAEQFHAINVELAKNVANSAKLAGIPLFINFTTLQAIEPPFRSDYARSKYEGELALNAFEGIEVVHLRLPAVYTGEFRGKLALLNNLPSFMRGMALTMLGALKPTLHVDKLVTVLQSTLLAPVKESQVITDTQSNNLFYHVCNRLMDLGFVFCVFFILWPLLVWAYITIRRDSAGPALFAQPRVGRYGKSFICYKFRTMDIGTKVAGTHEVSASTVTKVGHFLRRYRIDELPQAWNVMRAQMSVIGPRPCLIVQQELIECRKQRGVLQAKPGITGLAQVRGVDMSNPKRLAKLDAEYISRQSLLLDLNILIATLRGSGSKDYVQTP